MADVEIPWFVEPDMLDDFLQWERENRGKGPSTEIVERLVRASPAFLGHYYTKIQDTHAQLVPFSNWTPAQMRLYRIARNLQRMKQPVRIIVLKARQMGISTLSELFAYHRTGYSPNITAMIVAQEEDGVRAIFEKFRIFHATTPDPIRPETDKFTQDEIRFGQRAPNGKGELGLASRILTKTMALGGARKMESGKGRGATYHFMHASECAFWPTMMARRFMGAVLPAIPSTHGTACILESTANGTGNFFHDIWTSAAKGWSLKKQEVGHPKWQLDGKRKSVWVPVFLSWLEHPIYQMALPFKDDDDTERMYYIKHLDKEERRLVKEFGATLKQVEWRRYKLNDEMSGDLKLFKQEYPVEPDEAFQSSDRKVFDQMSLQRYSERVMAEPSPIAGHLIMGASGHAFLSKDQDGPLRVFRQPDEECMYVLGADPCQGRGSDGDYACAQVLCASGPGDEDSWEQVAVFNERIDPDEFGMEIVKLARWYNDAMIVCETNGPGQATTVAMKRMGYYNRYRRREYDKVKDQSVLKYDWHTNTKTRSVMVAALRAAIREMKLGLHDVETIEELKGWIRTQGGREKEAPSSPDGHDDRIMALGLALQGGLLDSDWTQTQDSDDDSEYVTVTRKGPSRYLATRRSVYHPQWGTDW